MRGNFRRILVLGIIILFFGASVFPSLCANEVTKEKTEKITIDDNVPEWKLGEKWTYSTNDIHTDIDNGHLTLSTGDLKLKVINIIGSSYLVELNTNFYLCIEMPLGYDADAYLKVEFKNSKISGDISYNKNNLGIEKIDLKLSGGLSFRITTSSKSIPAIISPYRINLNLKFDNPFRIYSFPLSVNNSWNLDGTNMSIEGNVWNLLFNFIKLYWRIYKILPDLIKEYLSLPAIPDEIASLLPVLDLKQLLILTQDTNILHINQITEAFKCINKETKEVSAGSFEAYHITFADSLDIYYAPKIGRIIEISSAGNKIIELKKHTTNINIGLDR